MTINLEALKALAIKSGATPGDLSGLTFAAAAYPSAILALIERVEAAERDAEPVRQAMQVPVREKNSQDWASCSGAVAHHLIDRHADGWADVGLMMEEWADARAIAKGKA